MKRLTSGLAALLCLPLSAAAQPTPQDITSATYDSGPLPEGQSGITVVAQVLLDRAGISPGIVDGYRGPMSRSAIRAFEAREGLPQDGAMDAEVWRALGGGNHATVLGDYTVSEEDTQNLSEPLPQDYSDLAEMDWLGFTSVEEKIAEAFHMDQDFLVALNPEASFTPGEVITVTTPGSGQAHDVTRIEVRKDVGRLAAFNDAGTMVANYPVTVGSDQLPSPSGTHDVVAIATEPTYSYKPDENFTQMDNTEPLTLPPGPNGPVGLVWIDLSKPTYGIHGTSDPSSLFQARSHGCVRMTNWDALALAEMVEPGVPVVFTQ
ncbi:L,D-transpeptidase family protein [Histidinibacterium aquaticum]|uniref:Murein L,D-transpeptidase n=1 Tax=Histidinibacterium aquaticum TaxID=2613962 RepID=A0A5J5GL41_9RHOB|nr:L,D-transpeptidase [Histidinibacterium aquaticum]KAA9008991.1 murein L,D-transpeptidase [Histidinibacterium aquaticum]